MQIVERRVTRAHSVEESSFLVDGQNFDASVLPEVGEPPIGRVATPAFKEFTRAVIDARGNAVEIEGDVRRIIFNGARCFARDLKGELQFLCVLIGEQAVGEAVGEPSVREPQNARGEPFGVGERLRIVEFARQLRHVGKPAGGVDGVFGVLSDVEFRLIEALAAHLVDEFDEKFVLGEGAKFLRSARHGGEPHADEPAVGQLLNVHGEGAVRKIQALCKFVDVHLIAVMQKFHDAQTHGRSKRLEQFQFVLKIGDIDHDTVQKWMFSSILSIFLSICQVFS